MLLINALKTVCDFLMYFSFAMLFNACSESYVLVGAVLLLAFISSIILQKTDEGMPARIICGLIPALGLFFAGSLAEVLFTAVVLIFNLVLLITGKHDISYEDYKYWFGLPAAPVAVMFAICLSEWPIRPAAVICAAFYLFLGVLVLRRKRIGAGAGTKLKLMNLAELTGVIVLGILACLLLFAVLIGSRKIIQLILMPFAFLLNALVSLYFMLGKVLSALIQKFDPDKPVIPDDNDPASTPGEPAELPGPEGDMHGTWAEKLTTILIIVVAVALLAYLLYRFYRMLNEVRLQKAGDGREIEEGAEEPLRFGLGKRKKKKPTPSNIKKVRMIYREYLFYVRTCGIEITRQTTSADVLNASGKIIDLEEAARLRELYIRARYNDADEMSSEEVREAEQLLADIKEQIMALKARRSTEPALK